MNLDFGNCEINAVYSMIWSICYKYVDGGEITLIVDIDAAKSVIFTGATKGDGVKILFKPVVKLSIEQ